MPITEINLPLNTSGWIDTGIVLPVPTPVTFDPTGEGTWDTDAEQFTYPEGHYTGGESGHANEPLNALTAFSGNVPPWRAVNSTYPATPVNPNDVVPLCAVGVVRPDGDGAPTAQVTDAIRLNRGVSTFTIGPGRLYIGFNDRIGSAGDNTGTFDVVITYPPAAPLLETLATPTFVAGKPALTIRGV